MASKPNMPPPSGPIAGMGLTAPKGSRPWQKPPKYSTVEDVLAVYLPKLTDEEMMGKLLDVMELGVPVSAIAETLQVGGVMQGLHTADVGILVTPVLIEMMAYIGDQAGIEYDLGVANVPDENILSQTKVAVALKRAKARAVPEELKAIANADEEELKKDTTNELVVGGLMARRELDGL